MYKFLKTLHSGGIRTRDLFLQADAMTTMRQRQGWNILYYLISLFSLGSAPTWDSDIFDINVRCIGILS
jgi:hypothetical protein